MTIRKIIIIFNSLEKQLLVKGRLTDVQLFNKRNSSRILADVSPVEKLVGNHLRTLANFVPQSNSHRTHPLLSDHNQDGTVEAAGNFNEWLLQYIHSIGAHGAHTF